MLRIWISSTSRRLLPVLMCAGLLLGACAEPTLVSGPQFLSQSGGSPLDRVYKLGVGDKLKVTVFGEENLSGQFDVNASGQISLPLIGETKAKELSLQQLRDAITTKLESGYLKNAKVTVEMLNWRPIYVHGEVKNGGEFQYKNGLRLRDAIAMAGGYTYRANQTYILMGRDGGTDVAVQSQADIPVLPGDNIRIPERFF